MCREALSARIDGEHESVPSARVDEHLEQCDACRSWYGDAVESTSRVRLRATSPAPDLTGIILAGESQVRRPKPGWAVLPEWPRAVLAGLGVAQILLGVCQLAGVDFGMLGAHAGQMGGHLFNESTAWNLAIGVGLLCAAINTHATSGLLPVLSGFVVVLTFFVVQDLRSGQVTVSRAASHGVVAAGLVMLVVVHRGRVRRSSPPSGGVGTSGSKGWGLALPPGARLGRRGGHISSVQDRAA